jgi:hypothetical protein
MWGIVASTAWAFPRFHSIRNLNLTEFIPIRQDTSDLFAPFDVLFQIKRFSKLL